MVAVIVGVFIWFPALQTGKIAPEVKRQMETASPSDHLKVIVRVLEPSPLRALSLEGKSKAKRHETVVRELQEKSEATQKPLLTRLEKYQMTGKVNRVTPLWIVNAIAVEATAEVIQEIAATHPNVEIFPDWPVTATTGSYSTTSWNLSGTNGINAQSLWNIGITGQNVVVATLDTGVDINHPDLAGRYRGGTNSWLDPSGQHATPVDLASASTGHGTWVTGSLLGGNASGPTIGVAPDARWIAAKIFADSGTSSLSVIVKALEWVLNPDGDLSTDDSPAIVNGSFAISNVDAFSSIYCSDGSIRALQSAVQTVRMAGIIPVFSSGNDPAPRFPAAFSESVAVGSTDINGNMDLTGNGQGPVNPCWTHSYYPDIVAPGEGVYSTSPGLGPFPGPSYYATLTGTSFAAPHVAGAAALLLSAYPDLTIDNVVTALTSTATFSTAPDNVHGYGRIDVKKAFDRIPPPPSNLTIKKTGLLAFAMTWTPSLSSSAGGFTYAVSRNGTPITPPPSASATSYTDNNVPTDSGSYTYLVSAVLNGVSNPAKGLLADIRPGNPVNVKRVDGFDWVTLLEACSPVGMPCMASSSNAPESDLNGDGQIDSNDLAILTAHFGQVMR